MPEDPKRPPLFEAPWRLPVDERSLSTSGSSCRQVSPCVPEKCPLFQDSYLLEEGIFSRSYSITSRIELLTLLAKFESCGPALVELEIPPCVPVCDVTVFPAVVPEYPAVRSFDLAPMFLEPSRSLSTVGSSLSPN